LDDLRVFLSVDKTDEHLDTDSFKCMERARALIVNATEEGWTCGTTILKYANTCTTHAVVSFHIDERYYFVDPKYNTIMDPYQDDLECIIIYPNNNLDPRLN